MCIRDRHNVFEDIQHRHKIVVLENKADLSPAENGQMCIRDRLKVREITIKTVRRLLR